MGTNSLFAMVAASIALAFALQSSPARAGGPQSAADDSDVTAASLAPGRQPATAIESKHASRKDLNDAYQNGYVARAKEDAETYASLQDQLRRRAKPMQSSDVPPLPPGMPGNYEASGAAPPPPAVRYVPVYAQDEEVPAFPVQVIVQPSVAVANPISQPGNWEVSFPRPYRDGPMIYQVSQ
jgi:hypothetical protein